MLIAPLAPILIRYWERLKWAPLLQMAHRCDPTDFETFKAAYLDEVRGYVSPSRFECLEFLSSRLDPADRPALFREFRLSEAQILQDLVALYVLGDRPGYFVEVGAGDGVRLSNTHYLEKQKQWDGLLIEPNPQYQEALRDMRSVRLDTRAAFSRSGEKRDFLDVLSDRVYSTLVGYEDGDQHERDGDIYEVETVTLNDAFEQHGVPKDIRFMSIDTEGSELEVLAGLDLNRYTIGFLAIEHNFDKARLRAIVDHVKPFGYEPILSGISQWESWFVKTHGALNAIRAWSKER